MNSTNNLFEGLSLFGVILLIVGILAFLLPIFVLEIRNELKSMNKKFSRLIEIMGGQEEMKTKVCPNCGAKNRLEDYECVRCHKPIIKTVKMI